MPANRPIVVYALDRALVTEVDAASRGRHVHVCNDASAFARAVAGPATGLVYQTGTAPESILRRVEASLLRADCWIVISVSSTPSGIAEFLCLSASVDSSVQFAFGPGDLRRFVARQMSRWPESSAVRAIVASMIVVAPPQLRDALSIGALMGQGRCSVSRWAVSCGCAVSSLRRRFASAALAEPRVWLGSFRALHAIWRYAELRMPVEDVAAAGQFTGASGLAHCVRRHTSRSLREWRVIGRFSQAIEQCASRCGARRA